MSAGYPAARPRRLRRSAAIRRLVTPVCVRPADLVLPLFVKEGLAGPQPVSSMPGVVQHTRDSLRKAAVDAVLTKCPEPCSRNTGSAAAMPYRTPLRLTSTISIQSSTRSSSKGEMGITPALLTSTSSRPYRAQASPASPARSPRWRTSVGA